ncbi:hypothetical protein KM043_016065 [Ampulex compressa]|nr:hypothetical protein KM043_016065 [Ampulex compressa]
METVRGKFGTVYRCKEKNNGLLLAAKVVNVEKKEDRRAVEREVEIMRRLQHPRLIQLYDAIDNGKQIYVILELIQGGELFERVIDDDFVLTERSCAVFVRQICEGIEFIHAQNILHLDLKPENILCLTKMGNRIKIIDFGLAREYDTNKKLQVLFGTPEFVAPEVVNFDQIGFGTDMWSIGVICYVLLSGLSPFMGDTDFETMANVTIAKYDFDHEAFAEISEDAKDFIRCLLLKEKEKRNSPSMCLKHPWLAVTKERRASPPKITRIEVDTDLQLEELEKSKDNLRTFVERWREHPYSPYVLENFGNLKDFGNFEDNTEHKNESQVFETNLEAKDDKKNWKGNLKLGSKLNISGKNLEANNDKRSQRKNLETENELRIEHKNFENDLKIHRKNLKLESDLRDQKGNLETENDFKIYKRNLEYSREIENYKEDLKSPQYTKYSEKILEFPNDIKNSKKKLDYHQNLNNREEMISLRGNSPSTRSSLSSLISESTESSSKENLSSYIKKTKKNQFSYSENLDKDQFKSDNMRKTNKFSVPENLNKVTQFPLTNSEENSFLLAQKMEENNFSFSENSKKSQFPLLQNSKENHLCMLEFPALCMERRASEGCTNKKSRFDLERKIFLAEEIVKLSEKLKFVASENIPEEKPRKKDIFSIGNLGVKETVIFSKNLRMMGKDNTNKNLKKNREECLDNYLKIKEGQELPSLNSRKNEDAEFSNDNLTKDMAEFLAGNSKNEIKEKLSNIATNRKINGTNFRRNQRFSSNLSTGFSSTSITKENKNNLKVETNLESSDNYKKTDNDLFSSETKPLTSMSKSNTELFKENTNFKKLETASKTAEEFSSSDLNVRKSSISISEKNEQTFRDRKNSENLAEIVNVDLWVPWKHKRAKKSFGEISRDVPRDLRLQDVHKDLNLDEPSTTKDLLLRLLFEWQEIDEKSSRVGRKSVSVDLFAEESVERKTMNSLAEYFQSKQKKF